MRHSILNILEKNPIIASVKDTDQLHRALNSSCAIIFLLFGDICSLSSQIEEIHAAGKKAVVHADLIAGLSQKDIVADYLASCGADGIISTRPNLIRRGGELCMLTVLRIFIIDSKAVSNLKREADEAHPDVIEILPGVLPRAIHCIEREVHLPVIAGGLIEKKEDIVSALSAGAICVSTTDEALWNC